jgi:hypothetical protein
MRAPSDASPLRVRNGSKFTTARKRPVHHPASSTCDPTPEPSVDAGASSVAPSRHAPANARVVAGPHAAWTRRRVPRSSPPSGTPTWNPSRSAVPVRFHAKRNRPPSRRMRSHPTRRAAKRNPTVCPPLRGPAREGSRGWAGPRTGGRRATRPWTAYRVPVTVPRAHPLQAFRRQRGHPSSQARWGTSSASTTPGPPRTGGEIARGPRVTRGRSRMPLCQQTGGRRRTSPPRAEAGDPMGP